VKQSSNEPCCEGNSPRFAAVVIEEACRGIDLDGSVAGTHRYPKSRGIPVVGTEAFSDLPPRCEGSIPVIWINSTAFTRP
jgi:hypothetical protein